MLVITYTIIYCLGPGSLKDHFSPKTSALLLRSTGGGLLQVPPLSGARLGILEKHCGALVMKLPPQKARLAPTLFSICQALKTEILKRAFYPPIETVFQAS